MNSDKYQDISAPNLVASTRRLKLQTHINVYVEQLVFCNGYLSQSLESNLV